MKIAITFDGDYLVLTADKAQPLVEALAAGQLYRREGWEDDKAEYIPVANQRKAKVLFVSDEQFTAAPEPFKKLQEELQTANRRWLDAYNAHNESEKRVKALEAKLQSIGVAITAEGDAQ